MDARAHCLTVLAFACLLPALTHGQAYRFSFAFGADRLQGPAGLFVHEEGELYVADQFSGLVRVFDFKGTFLREFGAGQVDEVSAVARDVEGNLYVVDNIRDHVLVFDGNGKLLFVFGERGSGPGQFQTPLRIAIQASGRVLVADHFGRRIEIFDRSGNFLDELTTAGEREFTNTWAVAVDQLDYIYAVDAFGSECAHVFDASANFLFHVGRRGEGDGECIHPHDVAVDGDGNIFVSDGFPNFHSIERIQVFTADGTFLTTIGEAGHDNGQFDYAGGVAVDQFGNVFVSDTSENRIQVFVPAE
jgi:DNA-binding beta-propeller fold protein YncE